MLNRYAQYAPIGASVLIEYSTVGHIYRMWRLHTAAGQNFTSWIAVWLALALYSWCYAVCTPELAWARRATAFSMCVVTAAIYTVWHFQ